MAEKKKAEKEKPLEKMTAKEMREIAMAIPGITGVHGMNKEELLAAIKKERGIADDKTGRKKSGEIRELKRRIKDLKARRQAALDASDKKMATIYRRRISRLKKKTHRAA
jgi:protein-arginine kinase activator protein McsA